MSLPEDIYSIIFSRSHLLEDFYKFCRISKKYCNIFWKTLTLEKYCGRIDDNILNFILQCVWDLKSLDLYDCNQITNDGLVHLQRSLQSLNLSHCDRITNDGLKHLPQTLQTLNLSWCDQITNDGLKSILPKVEIIR